MSVLIDLWTQSHDQLARLHLQWVRVTKSWINYQGLNFTLHKQVDIPHKRSILLVAKNPLLSSANMSVDCRT